MCFIKNNPLDLCQIVANFIKKNYPVCTLENVLSSTTKTFAHTLNMLFYKIVHKLAKI